MQNYRLQLRNETKYRGDDAMSFDWSRWWERVIGALIVYTIIKVLEVIL